jgi:hypothetical protein
MTTEDIGTTRVLLTEHPAIATEQDALDIIGESWGSEATVVLIPADRIDTEFFRLASGLAGAVLQKFVNYRLQVAIVGDISEYVEASDALRDFVYESNRGTHVWFLASKEELEAKLAAGSQ